MSDQAERENGTMSTEPERELQEVEARQPYEVVELASEEEWLDARKRLITGTDIAKIAGVHPYGTAFDVYAAKKLDHRVEVNKRMLWGKRLEFALANAWDEAHPDTVLLSPCDSDYGILVRRDRPWQAHTPDRLVYPGVDYAVQHPPLAGWEGKTAGVDQASKYSQTEYPDQYFLQNLWGLSVTALPVWHIFVLIGGNDDRSYTTKLDPKLEADLLQIGEDFWKKYILGDAVPEMDASEGALAYLRAKYPKNLGTVIRVSEGSEPEAACVKVRDLKTGIKALEREYEAAANAVKLLIGDADAVEGTWGKISFKERRGRVSYKGACDEAGVPEVIIEKNRAESYRHFDPRFKGVVSDEHSE